MISYAQNFEDVMLWRALKDVNHGAYIDVGACDPVVESVSCFFYHEGWRGVHVEPVPFFAEALRAARPDERVIEAAVGADGEEITIHAFEGTGLSTAIAPFAEKHKKIGHKSQAIKVACVSLSSIFSNFNRHDVHWLKIDVEGMESDVIESWGAHDARPWIVVVESTLPNSQELSHHVWEQGLIERDYEFVYFDGLNRFYLHASQAHRRQSFDIGPNIFDKFSVSEHTPLGAHIFSQLKSARNFNEELTVQRDRLSFEVESREQELARLRSELASRQAFLAEEIEIREKELVRLRNALKDIEERLASTAASIAERDAEITRLHIAVLERTKSFEETLGAQARAFESAVESVRANTTAAYEKRIIELQEEAQAKYRALSEEWSLRFAETEAVSATKLSAIEADFESRLAAANTDFESRFAELQQSAAESAAAAAASFEAALRAEAELQRKLSATEQAISNWQAEGQALQSALDDRAAQLAAALQETTRWINEAHALKAQVDAMRASTSWKISAPVRWLRRGMHSGLGGVKDGLRPVLDHALQFARGNPWIKPPILALARFVPPVQRKLDAFVAVRPPPPPENEVTRTERWNLTPDDAVVSQWIELLDEQRGEPGRGT